MPTFRPNSLQGVVRFTEIDEEIPLPVGEDKLQVLHCSQQHLQEGSPTPDCGHAPRGEVDVREVGDCLVELTVEVV